MNVRNRKENEKIAPIFRNLKDLLKEVSDFSCLLPIASDQLYGTFALKFDSVSFLEFFSIGGKNIIGAEYTSQIMPVKIIAVKPDTDFDYNIFLLALIDWYNPHLYQHTTGITRD